MSRGLALRGLLGGARLFCQFVSHRFGTSGKLFQGCSAVLWYPSWLLYPSVATQLKKMHQICSFLLVTLPVSMQQRNSDFSMSICIVWDLMKGSGSSSPGLRTRRCYCSKSLLLALRLFSPRLKTASSAQCSVSRSRQYQTNGPNRKGNTIKEGLLKYFSWSSTCPSISCRWCRRGCSSPDSALFISSS